MLFENQIRALWHKVYQAGGYYLVTLMTGMGDGLYFSAVGGLIDPNPKTRCVVDDFGNLVVVQGWL